MNRPVLRIAVCPGPTDAYRTDRFFPSGGRNHCQYSLHLPTRDGLAEWSGNTEDGIDSPKVVSCPSTISGLDVANLVDMTNAVRPTSLPLSQTSHPQFLEAGKTLCASPL